MDEYISKQSVIDYLMGYLNSIGECGADIILFDRGQRRALINSIQDISVIKGADVQPVKHGRWEVNGDRFYPFCSNCKYEPPKELIRCNALSLEPILTKYCPNCGFENGTKIYKGGDKDA